MFPCIPQSYVTQPATAIRREGYAQRIRVSQRVGTGPAVPLNFSTAGYSLRLELYIHQYTNKPVVLSRMGELSNDGLEMVLVLTADELQALTSDQYTEQVWLQDGQGNETLLVERILTLHQTSPAGIPTIPVMPATATTLTLQRTEHVLLVVLDRAVVIIGTGNPANFGYTHVQILPASDWVIPHGLGYNPAGIAVFDSAANCWLPDSINYLDVNTTILNFGTASFAGRAYLS